MAVTLIGEVVNSCDAVTGFTIGNISGDDDFVEGTGAIGVKNSAATAEMYTTTLGATAPYDFSSAGSEFGWHIIMWFNTKTPVNATSGLRIVVGNGVDRGHWYVIPNEFYKGGFITAVVDSGRDFDVIAAGTWTTTGNPGQLTSISEMGGVFTTTTSIMGSFNNCQLDQMTIGLGLRIDGGTVGSPNTFETVRAADEDTNFWGWWSAKNGAYVGKGKLYIGPATGAATSVFNDTAFSVVFADQRVAQGFYELDISGSNTTCSMSLGTIAAASSSARWSLTVAPDSVFNADSCIMQVADVMTMGATSSLVGTTIIDANLIHQSGSTITNCSILNANTVQSSSLIKSDDPSLISFTSFQHSNGHAIEILNSGTYGFAGNTFTDYGANETGDAAIFNNSSGSVTLNITNLGDTPTVRNGTGASTTINNAVNITIKCVDEAGSPIQGVQVDVQLTSDGTQILNTSTNASGIATTSYNYGGEEAVEIDARSSSGAIPYFPETRTGTITSNGLSVQINMREDNIIS